jgi:CheY-like chemotaxis protein
MNGRLRATSSAGVGSTFRFAVQFELAPQNQRKEHVELEDFHGRRVLVIDDNPTNCLILREALQAWGLESDAFGQPGDALACLPAAMAGERPYSLVLIDSRMPGMDGFETCAAIKRLAGDLPVVMLTSDARPEDATRRLEAGLAGYAVKPVKRADLLRLICRTIKPQGNPDPQPRRNMVPNEAKPAMAYRILVAEDSPDNRLLIEVYMKGSPHHLTFAEDGKATVDQFSASDFDLILMDMQMPVMDGLAAARTIRAIEQERGSGSIPIILLTANVRPQDVSMSRDAGCNAHLPKPISKTKLLSAIEEYGRHMKPPEETAKGALQPIKIEMPPDLEHIVPGYLANRRKEVPEMFELLAASNFKRLATLGHNLKGTGEAYGFAELTRIGADLERSAKHTDPGALRAQLIELRDHLSRVEIFAGA